MKKPSIKAILPLLKNRYGIEEFSPHHDPLSELILTILSQNTSDRNSRPAFEALQSSFNSWEDVLKTDTTRIAGLIKRGGLAQIKAVRIQQALQQIKDRHGNLDLDFLKDLPIPEAIDWLKELPGVGNKTANCVLLFALGKPALPVDTHIYRVSQRLRLIKLQDSLDDAHRILQKLVSPEHVYQFHVLMIEHGRQACLARKPRCPDCVLLKFCPSYNVSTSQSNE